MADKETFNIERVPIPDTSKRVPLSSMQPGDSVLFPLSKRNTVQSRASVLKREQGKVFLIKKIDTDNARVWRME